MGFENQVFVGSKLLNDRLRATTFESKGLRCHAAAAEEKPSLQKTRQKRQGVGE